LKFNLSAKPEPAPDVNVVGRCEKGRVKRTSISRNQSRKGSTLSLSYSLNESRQYKYYAIGDSWLLPAHNVLLQLVIQQVSICGEKASGNANWIFVSTIITPALRHCRCTAIAPGRLREIARQSGKQCSIGFQPVFRSYSRKNPATGAERIQPWAMLSWPFWPERPGTDERPRRCRVCEAALSDVNQPALGRQCHGLRAPNGVELFQNSRHVIFHGVLTDVEHLADFLIAFAKGHLLQHLKFALG
jgi:hypothetical protein